MKKAIFSSTFLLPVTLLMGCATNPSGSGEVQTVAKPPLVTAEEWGSAPQPIPDEKRHTPVRITVHHAGVIWPEDADPVQRIRNLQSWGQRDRDWPDLPYHYLISPDGSIFEGRPVAYVPETNTNYDVNGHIGIQLWGNFMEQRVVEEQLTAAVDLIAWLCLEHKIDAATISGHKDVAPGTSCPGLDLYRYIEDGHLEGWVRTRLSGGTPDVKPLPPLEDGPTTWIPKPARPLNLP